jgi:SNF2 family DNA or RNA helicase
MTKFHQKFINIYQNESTTNQQILQLLSVIYESLYRTDILDFVNLIGLNNEGKQYNSRTLKPIIEHLLEKELLVESETKYNSKRIGCNALIVETATRDTIKNNTFEKYVALLQEKIPISHNNWGKKLRKFNSEEQLIREIRIGIYSQDFNFIQEQIEAYNEQYYRHSFALEKVIKSVIINPFDVEWFIRLPSPLYRDILSLICEESLTQLQEINEFFELLEKTCNHQIENQESSDILELKYIEQLILRNRITEAETKLNLIKFNVEYTHLMLIYSGWLNFIKGNIKQAIKDYDQALKAFKKVTKKRKIYFAHFAGIFHILALIKDGDSKSLEDAQEHIKTVLSINQKSLPVEVIYKYLLELIDLKEGDISATEDWKNKYFPSLYTIESLLIYCCCYWLNKEIAKERLPQLLEKFCSHTEEIGYNWLTYQGAKLLLKIDDHNIWKTKIKKIEPTENIIILADLIEISEPWEISLNALINFNINSDNNTKIIQPEQTKRLAWFLTLYSKSYQLKPREQFITKKDAWSVGKPISLKRLATNLASFDYLTSQDLRVCSKIYNYVDERDYYHNIQYAFEEEALVELVGHPCVFLDQSPYSQVEIVKAELELLVKKKDQNYLQLELYPKFKKVDSVLFLQETPTRIKVLEITSQHKKLINIFGKNIELIIPILAKEKVLQAISNISSLVTIHSDIGGKIEDVQEIPAQFIPHLQLFPLGEGLKVRILACPFGEGGSYYLPGHGGEMVIAEIDGKRYQTTRNLEAEKAQAEVIINNCSLLNQQKNFNHEWQFDDLEDCLELLLQLQELKEDIIIEYPEGKTLSVTNQASFANLKLNIRGEHDWFAVNGELQLDDDLVLELQQLLALLEESPSRFISIGEGQFLALTENFRKRLEELKMFSEHKGKGVKFHQLSSLALQDFFDEVENLKADQKWKKHCQKIQAMTNFKPQLPSTFQGELRDYQLDGFNWLSRLAYWGVGACLADDMGLGKTIQALALIVSRASEGVTLIIAPTSVCFNWINEAIKFAPTLNPILFGSGNRQEILNNLQPFDLVICSYGLLQQEKVATMLAEIEWETIVLDEAQFIKNMTTKRSQSAMELQGKFKLITTGTPIENHLGELWTLFRFINPGLLGNLKSFNERFVFPIKRLENKAINQQLKCLIQPFILRRTKNQVLTELPPRTETILYVELSTEEMALYEALRREAIEKLTEDQDTGGQKHLKVLAALMKLRRCCCNPRLIMPETKLNSSKLEVFVEVMEELRENNHKALVFSQFVDHLQIVKNYLDQQKITYQYLDGSTPQKERQQRVKNFQNGLGDVFLISLKAGGTGLNLTAADYVIHLDPWWNPAVEDQASDRAYRIGQKRPVTIYRLVVKDTIEEKIVALHHHKRDLADSLLSGADVSAKMSTEELLNLIK